MQFSGKEKSFCVLEYTEKDSNNNREARICEQIR